MTITIHHDTPDTLHASAIAVILHHVAHTVQFNLSPATVQHDTFTRTRRVPGVGDITFTITK